MVEAKTYRFAGHSRADTAPYRPEGEMDQWMKRDPIALYRSELLSTGGFEAEELDAIDEDVRHRLEGVVASVTEAAGPRVETMFDNILARERV